MVRCEHITHHLDDYLDGYLDGATGAAVQDHLEGCEDCRRRLAAARSLRAALRAYPAPEPDAAFMSRALRRAAGGRRRGPLRPLLGAAMAATLALGLALGLFLGAPEAPVEAPIQVVVLSPERVETIHVAFQANRPVADAEIHLLIPAHLELAGRPGVRDLRWRADLTEGANLLALPLVALHPGEDYLEASVVHNGQVQRVRVALRVPHRSLDGGSGPRSGGHPVFINPV
jgi:hypothetical protein